MPNKDIYFVIKDGVAIQPVIPQDGLELYYDVKGKKNTDNYKGTLLDMSGNGRHGTLSNFAYEGVSGFTGTPEGGLLLDDVDDKIVRPAISGIEYTSASRNVFNTVVGEWELGTFDATGAKVANDTRVRLINPKSVEANVDYVVSVTTGYLISGRVNNVTNAVWAQSFAFNSTDGNLLLVVKKVDESVLTTAMAIKALIQLEKGSTATAYTPYIPLPIMTYQMNGNILSFEKDGTVKRTTKDANGNEVVVSRKGINLVRNGNFADETTGWIAVNSGISVNDSIMSVSGLGDSANPRVRTVVVSIQPNSKYYVSTKARVINASVKNLRLYLGGNTVEVKTVINPIEKQWYTVDNIVSIAPDFIPSTIFVSNEYVSLDSAKNAIMEIENVQMINLTEAYGSGNEPTLEYIQSHPEEFAWTPNPNDLIETVEIKNNLVGDLENLQGNDFEQHEDGVITYTNEAEEGSVVRVDIDGISDQPLRFRNATGEQVVITEHNQIDEDAIKKVEFQGNSVQVADKYREASGTSLTIDPTLHDRTVADKLIIGGTTIQKSDYYAKDGLITQSSNYFAKDGLSSQYVDTKTLGKNIFDSSKLGLNAYVSKDSGNSFIVSGGYSNSMTVLNPPFMGLLPNTSYTASMLVSGTGTLSASYGRVSLFNGTSWLHLNVGGTSGAKTTTFTTPSDISSYTQFFVYGSSDSLAVVTVSNIQLELGASATAFEPYKDTVKSGLVMELSGRNFFNDPATTTLQDRSGNGNVGTASGFQYRTTEYADRTADFTGKVSGSTTINPNIAKAMGNGRPSSIPSDFGYELPSNIYATIITVDGTTYSSSATSSGKAPQHLFSFNLIAEFEKAYGAIPSVDQSIAGKVAWLQSNLNKSTCVTVEWTGYGVGPLGNNAYLAFWNGTTFPGTVSNTSSTPTLLRAVSGATNTPIQGLSTTSGWLHVVASTDASDGVTPSTLNTDCVKLTMSFKPASGSDGVGKIKFDGIDTSLLINKPNNLTDFTLEFNDLSLIGNALSGFSALLGGTTWVGFQGKTTSAKFRVAALDGTWKELLSNSAMDVSVPHSYVIVCKNNVISLYVDGILQTSTITISSSLSFASAGNFTINGAGSSDKAPFKIAGTRLYNRALSASEVYQNYMAGVNLNVPSPTDPSPITSNLPAKTYKYTDGSDIYEFTLDSELRGIGTAVDKVVFDKVSKKAFVERRVNKVTLNGSENWTALKGSTNETISFVINGYALNTSLNLVTSSFILCNRLKPADVWMYNVAGVQIYNKELRVGILKGILSTENVAGFKSWLSTNNLIVQYQLATVTSTPITFTKVTSSPYTEVPMTFLTATPDPLHPADLYSNLPTGSYKYTSTDGVYEFTLTGDELRGIGTAVDKVVFDRVSKVAYLERRIGKRVIMGTEELFNGGGLYEGVNGTARGILFKENLLDCTSIDGHSKVSHFIYGGAVWSYDNSQDMYGWSSYDRIYIRLSNSLLGISASDNSDTKSTKFRAWLTTQYNQGTPVIVYSTLLKVTRTPLTFTKVTSSTKTEVPMTFLTNTPSLDYPASVLSVESGSKVITHGKNMFDRSTAREGYILAWGSGTDFATADSLRSDFIKVEWGKLYRMNYKAQVILFDDNKTYIKTYRGENFDRDEFAITGENSCAYVKLGFRSVSNSNISMLNANIQLEEGTVATAYEPFKGYQETTIPVTLRSIG